MNKKGQISFMIILLVIAIIAVVVLSIAFVFSNTFKLYAIGTAIAIVGLIYGFRGEGLNKQKSKVMIIALILGIGLILLPALGIMQTAFPSGTYIQTPTFYYYECAPASQPVESPHVTLTTGSSDGWISCPSNTDTCDLIVTQTEQTAWYSTNRRLVYQVCHASGVCESQKYSNSPEWLPWQLSTAPSVRINNLITGDKVWLDYQARNLLFQWGNKANGAAWFQTYKPFILWKVDMFGGGRTEYSSVAQGCKFSSSDASKLIDSVSGSSKQINAQSSTSDTVLPFYKTRNFIGTYVPISTANVNFVTYNGQQGYCLNRQVFAITSVTTNEQVYQIVDSNFNTRLATSVTCCPGENEPTRTCSSTMTWINKDIPVEGQCSAFKACAGADWTDYRSKTQIRYNCVNTKCVPETRAVGCVYNTDCSTGKQCDSYTHTCVDIGTGKVCPNGTTYNSLTNNCDSIIPPVETCSWYQEYLVKEKVTYGWYDVFKLSPKTNTSSGCYTSNMVTYIIIGILVIVSLIGLIIYYNPRKTKTKYKRK